MQHAIIKVISPDRVTRKFEATGATNSDCLDILAPQIEKFSEDHTFVMVFKQRKK